MSPHEDTFLPASVCHDCPHARSRPNPSLSHGEKKVSGRFSTKGPSMRTIWSSSVGCFSLRGAGHPMPLQSPLRRQESPTLPQPSIFSPRTLPSLRLGQCAGRKNAAATHHRRYPVKTSDSNMHPGGFLWCWGPPQRPSIRASRDSGQSLFTACARRRSAEAWRGAHPSDTRFPGEDQDPLRRLRPG